MPRPVNWRWVMEGSQVWVKIRKKWYHGVIHYLGPNKEENTTVFINVPDCGHANVKRKLRDLFSYRADEDPPEE